MIERTDVGPVAVLTLANGPVNVLDTAFLREITETFGELADDPARAVVLTGAGRAFSAGVDLRSYLDGGPEYTAEFLPALSKALLAVFTVARPVVAAVNGHAIAGGAVLALAADYRLMTASDAARIGTPELAVGVAFPRAALEIVVHAVGDRAAARLVFGADTLPPDQARELGLVDELVGPGELLDAAVARAERLGTAAPADTYAATKAQLRRASVERIAAYRAEEDARTLDIWNRRSRDGWTEAYLRKVTRK
jgi:enoyl-CoA hydratase